MTTPTEAERDALAEVVSAISDAPRGSFEMMGQAFDVLRGPIKDVAMAVAAGDRDLLAEAHDELREAHAEVKEMGR